MATCFVIQPFDGGKYDKRYDDVYSPAITAAGLEPYRVDKDRGVSVPIDAIEESIRSCAVCLADITTDNPNVWYELGYAFAAGRPVVMVCSEERTGKKYPFDIQHRTIIPYHADSTSDFEKLKAEICARLTALLKRTDVLKTVRENEQVAPIEGLSQLELAVLAVVAGSVGLSDECVSAFSAKHDMEQAGFTAIGFAVGLKRLQKKYFVNVREAADDRGDSYPALTITPDGWDWIEQNAEKFVLDKPRRRGDASSF